MYHRLIVNYSVLDIIFDTTASDTYVWNDSVYTSSGTYMQVFSTEQGCDSLVMLMLTMLNGGHQGIENPEDVITVSIYPNPTNGEVSVVGTNDEVVEILVMDMNGRQVSTFTNTNRFDLSNLPSGIYIVSLKTRSSIDTPDKIIYLKLMKK